MLKVILTVLFPMFALADGGQTIGNGGGLMEYALVEIWNHAEGYLKICQQDCGGSPEIGDATKKLLTIVKRPNQTLKFKSKKLSESNFAQDDLEFSTISTLNDGIFNLDYISEFDPVAGLDVAYQKSLGVITNYFCFRAHIGAETCSSLRAALVKYWTQKHNEMNLLLQGLDLRLVTTFSEVKAAYLFDAFQMIDLLPAMSGAASCSDEKDEKQIIWFRKVQWQDVKKIESNFSATANGEIRFNCLRNNIVTETWQGWLRLGISGEILEPGIAGSTVKVDPACLSFQFEDLELTSGRYDKPYIYCSESDCAHR